MAMRPMMPMAARCLSGVSNRVLADRMGTKIDSAVTQAMKRLEQRMQKDGRLAKSYIPPQRQMSNIKM
jgi:hypothetical protein